MCRRAAVMDEGREVFTLHICRALRGGRVPGESLTRVLVGPVGSCGPTGRVQPAIVSDNHRDTVWKQYRAPVVTELAHRDVRGANWRGLTRAPSRGKA